MVICPPSRAFAGAATGSPVPEPLATGSDPSNSAGRYDEVSAQTFGTVDDRRE